MQYLQSAAIPFPVASTQPAPLRSLTRGPLRARRSQSQAKTVGGLIFVSGQIPALPSGEVVEGSVALRTRTCIANLSAILEAAGSALDRVVKVNAFLTDMADFAEFNAEYERHFLTRPARSCVAVRQLPKGVNVEIECVATA